MYTVIPDMSAVMQNSGFRHCVSQSFFYSWLCVPLMSGDIPNTVISGCYYSAFDERNQKKISLARYKVPHTKLWSSTLSTFV